MRDAKSGGGGGQSTKEKDGEAKGAMQYAPKQGGYIAPEMPKRMSPAVSGLVGVWVNVCLFQL